MNFTVEWHEELESTNSFLRGRVGDGGSMEEGLVIAARSQTGGRGRGGRTWAATPGQNLSFSILLRPAADAMQCVSLPMATALAVSDLLAEFQIVAELKWPNDVLVAGGKICGILLDALADGSLVLGIGINVNMPASELAKIGQPATSMAVVGGKNFDVPLLLEKFLEHFSARYAAWCAGGFGALRSDWESRAAAAGSRVSRGVVAGYGEHGELLIRNARGGVDAVWSD